MRDLIVTDSGAEEHYFTIATGEAWSIDAALARLQIKYEIACMQLDLSEDTVVFCRFYLSDIATKKTRCLILRCLSSSGWAQCR